MDREYIEAEGRRLAVISFVPQAFTHMMIICHGFRGTKENGGRVYQFASRLNQMGLAVTVFDFFGSGESSGRFQDATLSSQARDLKVVVETMKCRYNVPLILLGRSFGGSTVLAAGSGEPDAAAFIFWSTPVWLEITFKKVLGDAYCQLQKGEMVPASDEGGQFLLSPDLINDFGQHRIDEYFKQVGRRPVLIIQGMEDQIVAVENAFTMHRQLPNSTLEMVAGADHRFLEHTAEREDITINWIKQKLLGPGE